MTQLEQTLIANARRELSAVLFYYQQKEAGITAAKADEAWVEYLGHFNAMNALLALAHQADTGLSEEGVQALLAIEEQHAAKYRETVN